MRASILVVLAVLAVAALSVEAVNPTVQSTLQPAAASATPLLAAGVWRHDARSTALRTLIATSAEVKGPGGLATHGAERAHYATLASDNTWAISSEYCKTHGGNLCTLEQLCAGDKPVGQNEIPSGIQYAPIKNADNAWTQLTNAGSNGQCKQISTPSWGNTAKKMNSGSKNLVACCDDVKGVLRSYLVPDGAVVDPAIAQKLARAQESAASAVNAMHKMQGQIAALTGKVTKIEASSAGASDAVVKELRDALALRGSSALVKQMTTLKTAKACCGLTPAGKTPWVQYSATGIYVDINMAKCGFTATPAIVTSMIGVTSHWVTTGATSVYSPHKAGFRIYINWPTALSPALANQYQWAMNWCAQAN